MATTNAYDDSDSHLPPRKRLLAGFKKQNNASSSSTSYSNDGSSSASTGVQTHLDNLLNDSQSRSPEELKATAALAVKVAKAARATANEKAIIASKAIAAAKNALELFASFPAEAKERSLRKSKQKRHVPVQLLYDADLAGRLSRAIDNSSRVVCDGHRGKKQKSVVTVTSTMYDGHDVAGVVDSDSSNDDYEVGRTRVRGKLVLYDNALKEKIGEESSSLLGKRRGRVKLKKLPIGLCASKDHENGITAEKNVQPEGSNVGVAQVGL